MFAEIGRLKMENDLLNSPMSVAQSGAIATVQEGSIGAAGRWTLRSSFSSAQESALNLMRLMDEEHQALLPWVFGMRAF
ncbi:MAG: hypothetical protein IPI95_13930 [Flavobacteriales bacterium]|nr:hypothetical protein [Flavobacteriales bacterium]